MGPMRAFSIVMHKQDPEEHGAGGGGGRQASGK